MKHLDVTILTMYLHKGLSEKERSEAELHLAECQKCRSRLDFLNKMQNSFSDAPFVKNNTFAFLKARIAEKQTKPSWHSALVPSLALLFLAAAFLFFLTALFQPAEKLVLTRAAENSENFSAGKVFSYPFTAHSQKDFQQYQIGQYKSVYVFPYSSVEFKNHTIVKLKQGMLLGQLYESHKTKFIVQADDLTLKIIGTKFSVRRNNRSVLVAVQHGHVQAVSPDETKDLYDNMQLIYTNGTMIVQTIDNPPDWYKISLNRAVVQERQKKTEVLFLTNNFEQSISRLHQSVRDLTFQFINLYNGHSVIEMKPVIEGHKVFFGTIKGKVVCFNMKKGTIEWEDDIQNRLSSSPLIYKSFLIITANNGFTYFIDTLSGAVRKKIMTGVLAYASPLIAGDNLILANTKGEIYHIGLNDLSVLWKKKVDDIFYATPVLYGSDIFIPSYSGKIYQINLKDQTCSLLADVKARFNSTKAIADHGRLFVLSHNGTLRCFNISDRKLIWSRNTAPSLVAPVLLGDKIIISSVTGKILLVDAGTGVIVKKMSLKGTIIDSPVLVGKYIFFANTSGIDIVDSYSFNRVHTIDGEVSTLNYADSYLAAVNKEGKVYIYRKQ